jgi:hypothetical protein
LFTPVFYIVVRTLFRGRRKAVAGHRTLPAE